jgi:hypothetical protein
MCEGVFQQGQGKRVWNCTAVADLFCMYSQLACMPSFMHVRNSNTCCWLSNS